MTMVEKFKYPRTYHLPYSLSKTDDDKTLDSDEHFKKMERVVVTVKMDGENTTVYPDGTIHARSLDSITQPWQHWLKGYIQSWCYGINPGWRVCGENLYAKHSIGYIFDAPDEYFQVFNIFDESNICLSWDYVFETCQNLGINIVPELYIGPYDKDEILKCFDNFCKLKSDQGQEVEGFVVRNFAAFPYSEFNLNTGKYVRANHVQTDEHWTKSWTPNQIK